MSQRLQAAEGSARSSRERARDRCVLVESTAPGATAASKLNTSECLRFLAINSLRRGRQSRISRRKRHLTACFSWWHEARSLHSKLDSARSDATLEFQDVFLDVDFYRIDARDFLEILDRLEEAVFGAVFNYSRRLRPS